MARNQNAKSSTLHNSPNDPPSGARIDTSSVTEENQTEERQVDRVQQRPDPTYAQLGQYPAQAHSV